MANGDLVCVPGQPQDKPPAAYMRFDTPMPNYIPNAYMNNLSYHEAPRTCCKTTPCGKTCDLSQHAHYTGDGSHRLPNAQ